MAIYHLSVRSVSRSKGSSSVSSAAYISRSVLEDERTGLTHDGTRAGHDLVHSELLLPDGAPERWQDRSTLWNEVEAAERRVDAAPARSIVAALPRELTTAQNVELAREYVRTFTDKGMVADLAIHEKADAQGEPQPHAHILLSTREIDGDEFGRKVRSWDGRDAIRSYREGWAAVANEHLARHDHDVRIDHRSFADQGIELGASEKIGPAASRREDRGEASERADRNREVARENGSAIIEDPNRALDAITRQQSTFTRQDLARFINRNTADAEQFGAVMAKVEASADLVRLGADTRGQDRFTSRDMIAAEQRMIGAAGELADRGRHGVSAGDLEAGTREAARGGIVLREDQAGALRHVTGSADLALVVGLAGTGKSTMLRAGREAWEAAGYTVHGATLSGKAAEGLEEGSGIASRTLASHEHRWAQGDGLTSRDVLVVDEAGMVGTRQLGRVLDHARDAGAKVVLVGDAGQLQAIEAGAAFRGLVERHGAAEITGITRQREDWQKAATRAMADGRTGEGLGAYDACGMVHGANTKGEAMAAAVASWDAHRQAHPGQTSAMMAFERGDVLALNELARGRMRDSGHLGADERTVPTEYGPRQFASGDRLLFRRNEYGELGVKNGTLGTVERMHDDGRMTVRLDGADGRRVDVDPARYGHLQHGYAATIHASQGVTVDRAYVVGSRYMDRTSSYTAMSRHRDGAELHWSRDQFADKATMLHRLGRDGRKDLAADYGEAAYARRRGIEVPELQAPARTRTRGHELPPQSGRQRGRELGFER